MMFKSTESLQSPFFPQQSNTLDFGSRFEYRGLVWAWPVPHRPTGCCVLRKRVRASCDGYLGKVCKVRRVCKALDTCAISLICDSLLTLSGR